MELVLTLIGADVLSFLPPSHPPPPSSRTFPNHQPKGKRLIMELICFKDLRVLPSSLTVTLLRRNLLVLPPPSTWIVTLYSFSNSLQRGTWSSPPITRGCIISDSHSETIKIGNILVFEGTLTFPTQPKMPLSV